MDCLIKLGGRNMFFDNANSLIVKTGQLWKIKLFFALILSGFSAFILLLWNYNSPNDNIFSVLAVGTVELKTIFLVLILLSFVVLFLLIKCPNCKKRFTYRIVSTSGLNNWITEICNLEKCPCCEYDGTRRLSS